MLKKLWALVDNHRLLVVTAVTICLLGMSLVTLVVCNPPPGTAWVLGFLNGVVVLLLWLI